MRFLLKAIAIVGCVTAASAAQAVPLFYDEADSGDIFARIGAIPVFNFDVGNNVIAGNQFFSGPNFRIADLDVFSFVVPENSVLSFVTVEFGAFEFTGPLLGFGPNIQSAGPLPALQLHPPATTSHHPITPISLPLGSTDWDPSARTFRPPVRSGITD